MVLGVMMRGRSGKYQRVEGGHGGQVLQTPILRRQLPKKKVDRDLKVDGDTRTALAPESSNAGLMPK